MKTDTLHHGWTLPVRETLLTIASLITLVRTVLAVGFAVLAIIHHNQWELVVAIACYWVGDIVDGIVARRWHQEMRVGAVLDIMADRLCVAVIYIGYGSIHPELMWAIGVYLFEFMFIDGFLSLTFLFWPLLSPNYFFLVDHRIFALNWSPAGKLVNSSFFLLATIFIDNLFLSMGIALLVTGIKLYSLKRLYAIGIPNHTLATSEQNGVAVPLRE